MPTRKKLKNSAFEFSKDERGFYYLKLLQGEEFVFANLLEVKAFLEEVHDNEPAPFLIELAYGSTVSTEVQEYLAYEENRKSTADAILISTFAHRLIAKFYLSKYKPNRPTKIFSDIFEALDWINLQQQA